MDEEDLAELNEGKMIVDTTEEMDLTGGTQAELGHLVGAEDEFVRPTHSQLPFS